MSVCHDVCRLQVWLSLRLLSSAKHLFRIWSCQIPSFLLSSSPCRVAGVDFCRGGQGMDPMMTSECAALIKSGYCTSTKHQMPLNTSGSRLSRCKEHNSLLPSPKRELRSDGQQQSLGLRKRRRARIINQEMGDEVGKLLIR